MRRGAAARAPVATQRVLLGLVLLVMVSVPRAGRADDTEWGQASGPYVAVAGGAWSIDLIGLSDGGPRPHGHAGGQGELGWLWGTTWATSGSFRWGGSWFDFDAFASQPLGHLREETWMVRFIVDRRFEGERGRSAWFGAGFLYGEAHIDFNTFRLLTEDPPPNFFSGGLVRAGAGFPLGGPLEVYGELEEALFRGRGGDPDFQERYRWLGRSLAGHVGLRLVGHRD